MPERFVYGVLWGQAGNGRSTHWGTPAISRIMRPEAAMTDTRLIPIAELGEESTHEQCSMTTLPLDADPAAGCRR